MKEVEKRGRGAYANNLGSVRLNDFSKRLSIDQSCNLLLLATLFQSVVSCVAF